MINRDERLFNEVVLPAYREMYKRATPVADFDEMMKTKETEKDRFYMKYYLSMDDMNTIIKETIKAKTKKLRIRKYEKDKIRTTMILGCSPASTYKKKIHGELNANRD